MMGRVLRFDTTIAVCALLISTVTAGTRSAQLFVDGRTVEGWSPLLESVIRETTVSGGRKSFHADSVSIDASNTVRPGDARTLLAVAGAPPRVIDAVRSHHIALNFYYCALNGQCWRLRAVIGGKTLDIPQPVDASRSVRRSNPRISGKSYYRRPGKPIFDSAA
jgi:hypothetical protein